MTELCAGAGIGRKLRSRKDPLPPPLTVGSGIFSRQRVGQIHAAEAMPEVALRLLTYALQMTGERGFHYGGQHREALFVPLTCAADDVIACQIDVFDSQPSAFPEPHPCSIQEGGQQPFFSLEMVEQCADLSLAQDNRQSLGPFRSDYVLEPVQLLVQHCSVQKEQGA